MSRLQRILALAMAVMVLGVGYGVEDGRPLRIAVHCADEMPEHVVRWVRSFSEHPAVREGLVEVAPFLAHGDPGVSEGFSDAIRVGGFDAAVVLAGSPSGGLRFVEGMSDAGIPVWTAVPLDTDKVRGYVGPNDREAGYMAAKAVFERLGGEGNVVVLRGYPGAVMTEERDAGIGRALAEYPGITLLDAANASLSQTEAFRRMEGWLSRYGGLIGGVVSHNDDMALGALRAMKAMGSPVLPLAGVDGVPGAVDAVNSGDLVLTLEQDVRHEAFETMRMILEHLHVPSLEKARESDTVPWTPISSIAFMRINQ